MATPRRALSDEHVEAAEAAGLRYVLDTAPGIRRRGAGKGFTYFGIDGQPIRDKAELKRIRGLVIPPAWRDVWVCPYPTGHLQVTARDAKGRKQYRYHPRYRAIRDETKFGRMLEFSNKLPDIRRAVERDLQLPGLPRDKVLATVVRLLEKTLIRVGKDEYARENQSFGLTTLRNRHVKVAGDTLKFEFRGKSGVPHTVAIADRRLARIVQRCQTLPGQELFQYLDRDGKRQSVDSGDINEYLQRVAGPEISAKDFRTWAGTMLAAASFREMGPGNDVKEVKTNILRAVDQVASRLGNTRAVCRKYYVHPALIDAYTRGSIPPAAAPDPSQTPRRERPSGELRRNEALVLAYLQEEEKRSANGSGGRAGGSDG